MPVHSTPVHSTLPDPSDLPALQKTLDEHDPERRLLPLGLHRMIIDADAVPGLADVVAGELDRAGRAGGDVVVLTDDTPITRDGEDLKAQVCDLLATRFSVRPVVLRGSHATLHVDDEAMDAAAEAAKDAACVVSVGGGTISDIGKVAVARADGDVPLVVVETAASVDGYADDVSVILRGGVKRTVPSRWPSAVVADVTTITQAPDRLTTAGVGEVISLFVAPADWYLASIFGLDDTFHPVSRTLFAGFDRDLPHWAESVARRDPEAIGQLIRTLALRGILGGVTGTTACLSGVEHVISHLLDMYHDAHDQPTGLHGAQVGVGSVVSAAAWQHLLSFFDPADVDLDALFPDPASRRDTVLAAFADLDPSGARGEECWSDYEAKLTAWAQARPAVEAAFGDWARHRAVVEEVLLDPGTLAGALQNAGAAARFADLDPAVDDATARWAVGHCHLMRNRFTVVDLLDLLGRWTDDDRAAVLAAAESARGGVR